MRVEYLSSEERARYRERLIAARDRTCTNGERADLFDELAERFGHSHLAESLKDFGLK